MRARTSPRTWRRPRPTTPRPWTRRIKQAVRKPPAWSSPAKGAALHLVPRPQRRQDCPGQGGPELERGRASLHPGHGKPGALPGYGGGQRGAGPGPGLGGHFLLSGLQAACQQSQGLKVTGSSKLAIGQKGDSGRAVTLPWTARAQRRRPAASPWQHQDALHLAVPVRPRTQGGHGRRGYGHGVGMSQWGAYGMAAEARRPRRSSAITSSRWNW